jgi:hypothetical protein
LEDVVTGPFILALDFADNATLKYEQATQYLIHQEEERLTVVHNAMEIIQYIDHGISAPYFKGKYHAFVATEDLQASLMELLDYQQDLSQNSYQATLTVY